MSPPSLSPGGLVLVLSPGTAGAGPTPASVLSLCKLSLRERGSGWCACLLPSLLPLPFRPVGCLCLVRFRTPVLVLGACPFGVCFDNAVLFGGMATIVLKTDPQETPQKSVTTQLPSWGGGEVLLATHGNSTEGLCVFAFRVPPV